MLRPLLAALLLALLPSPCTSSPFSIDSFGAIAGLDTHAQALLNGKAFAAALSAALAAPSAADRAVLVPAGSVYSFLPSTPTFQAVRNVTIFLEGTLNVSTANFWDGANGFPGWPNVWPVLSFSNCADLHIVSETQAGLVNGRGNLWWWYTILL